MSFLYFVTGVSLVCAIGFLALGAFLFLPLHVFFIALSLVVIASFAAVLVVVGAEHLERRPRGAVRSHLSGGPRDAVD